MAKFIQYRTQGSLYNGEFGGKAGWPAAGMGDVIITESGKLIVVDGGEERDANGIVSFLESRSDTIKPIVDLWIITHPHEDHYGALKKISESHSLCARIEVKKIIFDFPMEFKDANGRIGALEIFNNEMKTICDNLSAIAYSPSRGEKIGIDDVEIEFLYVPDDCSIFNSFGSNFNLCSLLFTVSGKNKRIMITGDAYRPSMQITAFRYGNRLRSDALQMPHHALCDSYCVDFYNFVAPNIIFMPISEAGYRAMHDGARSGNGIEANLAIESKAQTVYRAFDGTFEIDI